MAEAAFSFVEADTASILRITCKNKGTGGAIDIDGSVVKLLWKTRKGAAVEKTMTLIDAANGIAEYQFSTDELESPAMKFEVEITDGPGKVFRSLDVLYELVRKQLK